MAKTGYNEKEIPEEEAYPPLPERPYEEAKAPEPPQDEPEKVNKK